jgi:large subunit ribosomal protein L25
MLPLVAGAASFLHVSGVNNMSTNFELEASVRQDLGKGASRRLRRDNKVPAVIYGGGVEPVSLVMAHNKVMHSLENEAFYSHILTVNIDGKVEKAVLKDLQRHPYKPAILHLDLLRVNDAEKLRMNVPLHFIGEDVAPGVKGSGGSVAHLINDVEIDCLPRDLPEFIEVDISSLELDATLHLSDLKLPDGVELVQLQHGPEHDLPIVSIHMMRGAKDDSEEATDEIAPEDDEA